MNRKGQSNKIQTVLGTIEPEALGVTLTHEHLLIDLECYSSYRRRPARGPGCMRR